MCLTKQTNYFQHINNKRIIQLQQELQIFGINQNKPFTAFPAELIMEICHKVVEQFKENMNQWIHLKITAQEFDSFTEKKLKDQAEQQYVDTKFWQTCFVEMNKVKFITVQCLG